MMNMLMYLKWPDKLLAKHFQLSCGYKLPQNTQCQLATYIGIESENCDHKLLTFMNSCK